MHVFVSYSRRDAQFVTRLIAVLEGDGHDVWVDTDDIRGSEEWRASIVRGIRQSDVVVLVVSSRSMASDEVAREITVAAQEERRIVPVILEQAQLSDSIGYELAGVQHVSFVDRPFRDAVADLRAALGTTGAGAPSPGTRAPDAGRQPLATTHPRRRTALMVIGVGVAVAAMVALVARNVGSDDPDGTTAVSPVPTGGNATGGNTSPAAGAMSTAVDIGAEVWFAGYEIAVQQASFDPEEITVTVDVTLTNVQPATAHPVDILLDDIALEWEGRRKTGFCDACDALPPGASLNDIWTFHVDDGFALAAAVLTFGQPRDHRAAVPFDGSPATDERPETLPVEGVINAGAGTTFAVERVELVPAGCSGPAYDLAYEPGPTDQISVVVWGTAVTEMTSVGLGTARLVLPDGTTSFASSSLKEYTYALEQAQPERDIPICFALPTPATGEHRVLVAAGDAELKGPGITFDLAVE